MHVYLDSGCIMVYNLRADCSESRYCWKGRPT